jgi:hypothetical protein
VSQLGRFLEAGWKALVTGELPAATPVSDGRELACPVCHGAGELAIDGVYVACPNPKHARREESR